jgi:hypothetical protein
MTAFGAAEGEAGERTSAGLSRPDSTRRWVATAVAVGVVLAGFSVLADGVIPSRTVVILGNVASPWAIVAFAVGRTSPSARRGALTGALTLSIGVVGYYLAQAARLTTLTVDEPLTVNDLNPTHVVWLLVAVTIGSVMGLAGAASKWIRPPIAAGVALSAALIAEAGFMVLDRRPWLWNLSAESYRVADLAIMVGLVLAAFTLPAWLFSDRTRRRIAYLAIVATGAVGTIALVGLYRLIVWFV